MDRREFMKTVAGGDLPVEAFGASHDAGRGELVINCDSGRTGSSRCAETDNS